jgi:hypothetical protein
MPGKAALLQFSRKTHLYLGLFIAPTLLFFAFTGAYQTLSLHEGASNYQPPAILASLGQIHKKQTYIIPVRRPPGPSGVASTVATSGSDHDRPRPDTGHSEASSGPHQEGETAAPGAKASAQRSLPTADSGKAEPTHPTRPETNPAAGRTPGEKQPMTLAAKQRQHLPLKVFFVLVALGLLVNTLTGIYMAFKYDRNRVLVSVLLVAGAVLPLVLVSF